MAIQYVQDGGYKFEAAVDHSDLSFTTQLPTIGNHVFALIGKWNNYTQHTSATDNQGGNSWHEDAFVSQTTGLSSAQICSAKVAVSSGTFTVTAQNTSATSYWAWTIAEFSGLNTSAHLDQTGTQTETAGATGTTVTATGANTTADSLVLAVLTDPENDPNRNYSDPPSGGAGTWHTIAVQQNGSADVALSAAYKIVSSIETAACTWSFDALSGVNGSAALIATYKGIPTASNNLSVLLGEPVIGSSIF